MILNDSNSKKLTQGNYTKDIKRLTAIHDQNLILATIHNDTGKTIYSLDISFSKDSRCKVNKQSLLFNSGKKDMYDKYLNDKKRSTYIPNHLDNILICKICNCKWSQFNRMFIKKIISSIYPLPELTYEMVLKYCGNTIIWNNETLQYSLIRSNSVSHFNYHKYLKSW